MPVQRTYDYFLRKTLIWIVSNAAFGLTPLLFMLFINYTTQAKVGHEEINHLIHDGVIVFVCCAIMGSVLVDFALGEFTYRIGQVFLIYIFPICVLGIIATNYLFINIKIISEERFDLGSFTTILSIIMSFLYCIVVKTSFYMREQAKIHGTGGDI